MQVSSEFLQEHLFSNFEAVFGKDQTIDVLLSTEKNPALLHVGKDGSWFEAESVNIRIMNPYSRDLDPGYEVAIIRGSAKAEIDFQLELDSNDDSKYELVAKLRNVKLEVSDLKTYFDSEMI